MKTSDDFISFSYQTIAYFNQDFIVSSMGNPPLNLIPTTLAICSYNLEEVENCGNHVLVSGEIVETDLEIIKDGGIVVFGQFSRLSVIFIWLPF